MFHNIMSETNSLPHCKQTRVPIANRHNARGAACPIHVPEYELKTSRGKKEGRGERECANTMFALLPTKAARMPPLKGNTDNP